MFKGMDTFNDELFDLLYEKVFEVADELEAGWIYD